MAASLITNVWAGGRWYGPSYPDAGQPPAGLVMNPSCWEGEPPKADPAAADSSPANPRPVNVKPPPKSGPGSGDAKWTEYAEKRGVSVTADMSRSEVIAACEAAGVPTD